MKVALFVTCLVDMFFPEVGDATVRVLRRQGVAVDFPAAQTCCGQAHFNAGYRAEARGLAQHFCEVFGDAEAIVAPSGSCVGMVKSHYPELVGEDRARAIGERTWELTGFLRHVLGVEDVGATYRAAAAYHGSCHLRRELAAGDDPKALLANVRGLEVTEPADAEQCCGFGGTFSMTMGDVSTAMADAKIARLRATGAGTLIGADVSCLMHLQGRLRRQGYDMQVRHVAEVLDAGAAGGGGPAPDA